MPEKTLTEPLRRLYKINLGVKKDERVLVFTDRIKKGEVLTPSERNRRKRLKETARLAADIGKEFSRHISFVEYDALESHGVEPPEEVWREAFGKKIIQRLKSEEILERLRAKKVPEIESKKVEEIIAEGKKDAVDIVIALSNFSTSHTKFRDLITKIAKARYASMPLFDPDMLFGAMDVDWHALKDRTEKLAKVVGEAEKITVISPNGTDIILGIHNREVRTDTGILMEPGSFGNLPAGEAFFAPLEGTAKGILVLEWAPTHRLDYPVRLSIESGAVVDVEGEDEYAVALRERLEENPDFRNIAELGIGTNDKASRPDNILEAEKILGTVHIALGDNSSFGGSVRTPFHQDFVVFNPTVTLMYQDGRRKMILDNGRLEI